MFKENIADDKLSRISGGHEYVSDENAFSNALNYYIDLLPFTSRKHVRIKYNLGEFVPDESNENLFKRDISQTVELNDMKWSVLSGAEKRRVCFPPIAAGFVAGGVAVQALARFISKRYSKQ